MGLYPAWQSFPRRFGGWLEDGGRAMTGSLGQQRFRRGLVAAQVGLSVVLARRRVVADCEFRPA